MALSKLPLSLFRDILDFVVGSGRVESSFLRLRLVDRFFDREVIIACARARLLLRELGTYRYISPAEYASGQDFIARYLLEQPHHVDASSTSNLSTLLNAVVDGLLNLGEPRVSSQLRSNYMQRLCRKLCPYELIKDMFAQPGCSVSAVDVQWHVIVAAILLELDASRLLQDHDLDIIKIESDLFGTPLSAAIETRQYNMVFALLERGVNVNIQMPRQRLFRTPLVLSLLDLAVVKTVDPAYLRLLLKPKYGCVISSSAISKSATSSSAISSSAYQHSVILAMELEKPDMAMLLLEHSQEPIENLKTVLDTGLCTASRHGFLDIVSLLMNHIPDYNTFFKRLDRCAPLEQAVWKGHIPVVRLLLSRGACPLGRHPGWSMLAAVWGGQADAARILLQHGFVLKSWSKIFEVAAPLIQSTSLIRMLLEENIVDLHAICPEGNPEMLAWYMSLACSQGNTEFVKLMVQHGARLDDNAAYASHGHPLPLVLAKIFRQDKLVAELLRLGSPVVDPLTTCVAEQFATGLFPREPPPVPECRLPQLM